MWKIAVSLDRKCRAAKVAGTVSPAGRGIFRSGDQKEAARGGGRVLWRQASHRNHTVDVGMQQEIRSPGVEDTEHADVGAEVLGVTRHLAAFHTEAFSAGNSLAD
jgi:hypothetical protein